MSFTALLWVVLYCSAIVLSFLNPIFGALGYLLEYYMRPELKWWGDELPQLRYNLIISIVLGGTFLLRRGSLREMVPTPNPALRWLLILGCVMIGVTATVAVDGPTSVDWATQWTKMAIILPLLLVGVIRTPGSFNAFIAAHMLGAFWWGWDAWMDPKRAQGRLLNIGSGDTLNDNGAAAHLLTVLPFAVLYLLTEKDKRLRAAALLALPFVINTLILCNSRGSMIALGAALGVSVFLVRTGYRLRLVGAAIGVAALLFSLADTTFITRQQSTADYENDGSAQQRLITWKGAYRLIKERPFGAGGRGFHLLSPIYIPEIVEAHEGDLRAPHNTYVMVLSEWGIPGMIAFTGFYAAAFVMLRRIKRRAGGGDHTFYYWRAFSIQLALVAFLVAAVFTDRLYAEAGYWMVGLTYALYRMQITQYAEDSRQTVTTATESGAQGEPAAWPAVTAEGRYA